MSTSTIFLELFKNTFLIVVTGIRWSNLYSVGDSSYRTAGSAGIIMIFSIIGAIFHFFMAVYIHQIIPGRYGIAKHPLYFIKVWQIFDLSMICNILKVIGQLLKFQILIIFKFVDLSCIFTIEFINNFNFLVLWE